MVNKGELVEREKKQVSKSKHKVSSCEIRNPKSEICTALARTRQHQIIIIPA